MSDQSVEGAVPAEAFPAAPGTEAPTAPPPQPDPEDRWLALLSGQGSAEDVADLIEQAAAEIDARLQQEPDVLDQTLEAVGKRVAGTPSSDTWNVLMASLKASLGWNASYLISWIAYDDPEGRLNHVEKVAPAGVTSFLRVLIGVHGPEIEVAISASINPLDDWRRIYKRVYYDQLSQSYTLTVRLSKLNGQEVVLEGSPDSMLNLTRHLMVMLTSVGSVDAFSEAARTPFDQQLRELVSLFYPDQQPQDGAAPSEPAPPAG